MLPEEVIDRLHTGDGESLFLIETPDGGYRLTRYDAGFEERMAKADDNHRSLSQNAARTRLMMVSVSMDGRARSAL